MSKGLRILTGIIGAFFALQGLMWVVQPAAAAEGLGMPLLDGMGRSSQAGDFTAFFLSLGGMVLYGAWKEQRPWIQAGAVLLLMAALGRTLAAVLNDAAFAAQFIGIEIVFGALLLFCASRVPAD